MQSKTLLFIRSICPQSYAAFILTNLSNSTILNQTGEKAHLEDGSGAELAAVHQAQQLAPHDGHLLRARRVQRKHRAHRLHKRQRRRTQLLLRQGAPRLMVYTLEMIYH